MKHLARFGKPVAAPGFRAHEREDEEDDNEAKKDARQIGLEHDSGPGYFRKRASQKRRGLPI